MWHCVHDVGPDFWPARFFSLWHLVHNLFITGFFFSLPSACNFLMDPDFWGNRAWHIWQSSRRAWCWWWGKGTLPLLPPASSIYSAPLSWVAMELAAIAPAIMAVIDTNITKSLSFILTRPCEFVSALGRKFTPLSSIASSLYSREWNLSPRRLNWRKLNWGA